MMISSNVMAWKPLPLVNRRIGGLGTQKRRGNKRLFPWPTVLKKKSLNADFQKTSANRRVFYC